MDIRERILKGAEELFMRYGFKTMTMDDVAKHLSVSKKTIYLHFKDKNALVESVMENHMQFEQSAIIEIRKESANAIEELYKVSKFMKTMMMDMNPSVVIDLQKYHPKAWKYFSDHKHECITKNILENLNWGVTEGFYRKDLNCEILALLRVEQIEMGFNPSIFPSSKFTVLEVQMELLNHFVCGIVSKEGQKLYNEYIQNNG